jgi:hypothetical protein
VHWLLHLKRVDRRQLGLGHYALDSLLDLLACTPTGNRDPFEDGKPHPTHADVSQLLARGAGVHCAHFLLVQRLQGAAVLSQRYDLLPVHLAMPFGTHIEAELPLLAWCGC